MSAQSHREAIGRIVRDPVLLAMELMWRWSFGLGLLALGFFAYAYLRQAVLVTDADEAALASSNPYVVASAVFGVLSQALPFLLRILAPLLAGAATLWIAAATLGRGVITRALLRRAEERSRRTLDAQTLNAPRWASFAMLYGAQVLMLLILVIGYLGGVLLASLIRGGANLLINAVVVLFSLASAAVVWTWVNHVLSLAPLCLAAGARSALDAIVAAIAFARSQGRALRGIALANVVLRATSAVLITALGVLTVAAHPPALWLGVLLGAESVAYLLLSDLLLLARLEAQAELLAAAKSRAAATEAV